MSQKVNTPPVVITGLEIENVKRVQTVSLTPTASGLTVIGGDNRQGKTSVLDAIMATLGGEKFTPSKAVRDGTDKGSSTLTLSNGFVVARSFTAKGAYLKVEDPSGRKGGQALLNEFVSEFALDLGRFAKASDKEKAKILLDTIGVDLTPFEERHAKLYAEREQTGRLRDRAKHHAEAMPYNEAVGSELQTPTDIMAELERKVQTNARNREIRSKVDAFRATIRAAEQRVKQGEEAVGDLRRRLTEAEAELAERIQTVRGMQTELSQAMAAAEACKDEDTQSLKERLAQIEDTNQEIRKNLEREKALSEAEGYAEEYRSLSHQLEQNAEEKRALLDGAALPLPGLSVEAGLLTYNGKPWDCMSGADQLIAATAIVRRLNPRCGFVLLDGIEAMDLTTLTDFDLWLRREGLQAITTRVSKGSECSVIIVDGHIDGEAVADEPTFG